MTASRLRTLVPRILVTGEGARAASSLLAAAGFEVVAADAPAGADLAILDATGADGPALCRRLRASSGVPIILLMPAADAQMRVAALEAGADDCLTAPVPPPELLARVRALLRRSGPTGAAEGTRLSFAGWMLDFASRELRDPAGAPVSLTGGEFRLLLAFCRRPQRVLSRDQILDLTHGGAPVGYDRSVDILVSRLRRKIEPDRRRPRLIRTVRAGGYLLDVAVRRR